MNVERQRVRDSARLTVMTFISIILLAMRLSLSPPHE